ncbi:MAG: DUF2997 domain-containing protein [Pirellulales bacterium]
MKIIEVTVNPQGETTVQTKGFVGGECQQASRFIESSLGIATSDHKTSEFYAAVQDQQQIRQ